MQSYRGADSMPTNSKVVIRPVKPTEAEQAARLDAKAYGFGREGLPASIPADIFSQVADPRLGNPGILIGAFASEKLVGYYLVLLGRNRICNFAATVVDHEYNADGQKGIGTMLNIAAMSEAYTLGYSTAISTVAPQNFTNLVLTLNKLEWRVTGYAPDKYGKGEDRFYIEKQLLGENPAKEYREKMASQLASPTGKLVFLGNGQKETKNQGMLDNHTRNVLMETDWSSVEGSMIVYDTKKVARRDGKSDFSNVDFYLLLEAKRI